MKTYLKAQNYTTVYTLVFLICSCSFVHAATYYLDSANGSDSNPGTSSQPWQSLDHAQSVVVGGDTVYLRDGAYGLFTKRSFSTYNGSKTDVLDENDPRWITWKAQPGHSPLVGHISFMKDSGLRWLGYKLEGITVPGGGCDLKRMFGFRMLDCEIYGVGESVQNSSGGSISIILCGDVQFENCEFHYRSRKTLSISSSHGISVIDCEIYDVGEDHITLRTEYDDTTNVLIQGNILRDTAQWDDSAHPDAIQFYCSSGNEFQNCTVRNNIIYNMSEQGIFTSNGPNRNLLIENNLVYRCGSNPVLISRSVDATFRNNTVIGYVRIGKENTNLDFYNNIVCGSLMIDSVGDFGFHNYNIFIQDWKNWGAENESNSYVYPRNYHDALKNDLFIDADNHDYRLKSGSRAVNFSNYAGPVYDLLYNSRDAQPDAGCYEYQSGITDSTPPSAPSGLTATVVDESTVTLAWQTASDPQTGIHHYKIYRSGIYLGQTTSTSYTDSTCQADTMYYYTVTAVNGANLESSESDSASAMTTSENLPPSVVSVSCDETLVEITFSEALDQTAASNVENYSIDGDIVITDALYADNEVILVTSAHAPSITYTLSINNIEDTEGAQMSAVTETYSYVPLDLTTGLVGFWKLNDAPVDDTLVDSAGSNLEGTLIGDAQWTGSSYGEVSVDGDDDAFEISTSGMNAQQGTIALWIQPDTFPEGKNYIIGHAIMPFTNRIQLYAPNGALKLGMGDTHSLTDTIFNLETDTWYHIALTWDQNTYTVYVNGEAKQTGSYQGLTELEQWLDAGNNGSGIDTERSTEAFHGLLDEIRTYNRALSADEIWNLALLFLPIEDKEVDGGDSLTFLIRARDNVNMQIQDHNLPSEPMLIENLFSWNASIHDDGQYQVTFLADNGEVQDTEAIQITANATNTAPNLASVGAKSVETGSQLQFSVSASDPDGDTVTITASNLPEGAAFENDTFTWTPESAQAGTYSVTFTASDPSASDSETVTIEVSQAQQPEEEPDEPTSTYSFMLSLSPDRSNPVDLTEQIVSGTIYVHIHPAEGISNMAFYMDNTSCTGTPTRNERFAPWDLGGTPGQAGPYNADNLSQGAHTLSAKLNLTNGQTEIITTNFFVGTVENLPPVLASIAAQSLQTQQTCTFDVSATDPESDSVTITAQNLPSGAVFTNNTFTWTPGVSQAGTYTVTFTASDGENTDTETVTITVTAAIVQEQAGEEQQQDPPAEEPQQQESQPQEEPEQPQQQQPAQEQQQPEEETSTYSIMLSSSSNRSNPVALAEQTLSGSIYVFISPADGIRQMNFFMDNTNCSGNPCRRELMAPWDLGGTNNGACGAYNVDALSSGEHTLTAQLHLSNGETELVTTTFYVGVENSAPTITAVANQSVESGQQCTFDVSATDPDGDTVSISAQNLPSGATFANDTFTWTPGANQTGTHTVTFTAADGVNTDSESVTINVTAAVVAEQQGQEPEEIEEEPQPEPTQQQQSSSYELMLSFSSNRTGAINLDSQVVSENIYVFVAPETGIRQVDFYIDDTACSGHPCRRELMAPWDLGGTPGGVAQPYNTKTLQNGSHTLTAVIYRTDGQTETIHYTFQTYNFY